MSPVQPSLCHRRIRTVSLFLQVYYLSTIVNLSCVNTHNLQRPGRSTNMASLFDQEGYEKSLKMKLEELERWYIESNPESAAMFNTATSVMPGGNTRTVLHHTPFPLVLESGRGTMVTSKDGKEYIDFVSEYSAAMYGHSHPRLHEAISEAMQRGMQLGSVIGQEAEFASLIQKRFPSMELMRFTNSGTEATTMAVAAALAFTGRKKVQYLPSIDMNPARMSL